MQFPEGLENTPFTSFVTDYQSFFFLSFLLKKSVKIEN